jgi:branched-chain amino acid aminotransferase
MYYVNGQYLADEQATISVLDLGLMRGYGVFDYLRTYRGRPFHLLDHLLRLKYSAEQIGMLLPLSLEEIEKIIDYLLEQNRYPEASIKILITGGISEDQLIPQANPSSIILVYPLQPFPAHFYSEGITAITTPLARSLPMSKTTQYVPAILALQKGKAQKAQEALYLNERSEILEATTSNFFAFDKRGTLLTCASEEILFGITREVVLKLASAAFPIKIRPISYSEIPDLKEAFLTSSNKEVMPLTHIDAHPIGEGKIGKRTQQLMQLFTEYTRTQKHDPLNIARYTNLSQIGENFIEV